MVKPNEGIKLNQCIRPPLLKAKALFELLGYSDRFSFPKDDCLDLESYIRFCQALDGSSCTY